KVKNNHLSNSLESGTVQDSVISPTTSPDNHIPANPMSPGPDLTYVLANCNISYSYPRVTIKAKVKNQGDVAAPYCILRYYLREYHGTQEEQIGSDKVPALDPGSYSDQSITVDIGEYVGNWNVRFIIDDLNTISEDNEYNNVKTFSTVISVPLLAGSGPDLTYVPELCKSPFFNNIFPGVYKFTINSRIINTGKSSATGSSIGYYFSEDSHISTSDNLIAEDGLSSLNPGSYSDKDITGDISDYVGTWWVGFIIDNKNSVNENDELNNVWCSPVPWHRYPDLYVSSVIVMDGSGPEIIYQYTVNNNGNASTGAGFKNYIYLSPDGTITHSDYKIDEHLCQELDCGGLIGQWHNWDLVRTTVSNVPSGDYYLGVYTDGENVITELDEDDNTGYDNDPVVTIPEQSLAQPDLYPIFLSVTDGSGPGIEYQYTCKNLGTVSTGSGFKNYIYLSP
ncbi:MAG: CARDB domain-containing protein, partial [bacterium]